MSIEDIEKVGVVGSGLMGHGIALAFAMGGYPTLMCDMSDEVLHTAMEKAAATARLFVEEGLITAEAAEDAIGRLSTTTDLAELAANSDFVTEAIVERSQDKRELFNKLDELCPPHTIIVSNTSSLVLSDFGSDVRRQDKIAVTHYFSPPAIVPGVEVARGPGTSDDTYETAYELMKRIRHVPIRINKEMPGYLLNRLQAALSREANRLWAEGVASAEDIDLGVRSTFGFRMPQEGPMMHYDLAGVWRWPKDVRLGLQSAQTQGAAELSPEAAEKIKARLEEGTPWFEGSTSDAALEERDRAYLRRLKAQYWTEEV
ncbi:MAG: 3-hydroxyacyl-CoA dehydrogenase family protein [Chloroflexi bacterium]|nr:3-hydroxyacyl-CoA dehydrogenase family protein [Chloroflexota bacterium]